MLKQFITLITLTIMLTAANLFAAEFTVTENFEPGETWVDLYSSNAPEKNLGRYSYRHHYR